MCPFFRGSALYILTTVPIEEEVPQFTLVAEYWIFFRGTQLAPRESTVLTRLSTGTITTRTLVPWILVNTVPSILTIVGSFVALIDVDVAVFSCVASET